MDSSKAADLPTPKINGRQLDNAATARGGILAFKSSSWRPCVCVEPVACRSRDQVRGCDAARRGGRSGAPLRARSAPNTHRSKPCEARRRGGRRSSVVGAPRRSSASEKSPTIRRAARARGAREKRRAEGRTGLGLACVVYPCASQYHT